MAKFSLFKSEKSKNYKYIDGMVRQMFQVGGVDMYIHKYIGPINPDDPNQAMGPTAIQDVVFLENRDRKYDNDIYIIRGHFQVQDIDYNLSQFGLFLQNDTVFATIHINDSVNQIGRKIMAGDVFELPNLIDEHALNDFTMALKRFYVVEEVNRAAEGFSQTWYPHLYRIKLKPVTDGQEFRDIFDVPVNSDIYAGTYDPAATYYAGQVVKYNGTLYEVNNSVSSTGTQVVPPNATIWSAYTGQLLSDVMSTKNTELTINNSIVAFGQSDAFLSGFDTSMYYTVSIDPTTGDTNVIPSANPSSVTFASPIRSGYTGYLVDDGIFGNSNTINPQFGSGIIFPVSPVLGDYFVRIDYIPYKLFRFDGTTWVGISSSVRMELTNTDTRMTQKTSFINNDAFTGINLLATDTVNILSDGTASYQTGEATSSFTIVSGKPFIVVNLAYDISNVIEIWINEESRVVDITITESSTSLAFTINDTIPNGSRIRYKIYDHSIQQRQYLTHALKNLNPVADN